MSQISRFLVLSGVVALSAIAPASAQQTSTLAVVGSLECDVSSGIGLIITSKKALKCIFFREQGQPEIYVGSIRRFGLDIGATAAGKLDWQVKASVSDPDRGILAGDYNGISASATFGAGVGTNALMGGDHKSFVLEPFTAQVQVGLDIAAGVSEMILEYVPTEQQDLPSRPPRNPVPKRKSH